jgi:pantoate--beta-alanine ligase
LTSKFFLFLKIIETKEVLSSYLNKLKLDGLSIGLVPTMGALHSGHISLLNISKKTTDITVASIFVNPTQFNNHDDLLNYPKPLEQDIEKLTAANCDVLFLPSVEEMYPANEAWDYEVGDLDFKLEGEFRPGHYKGVTQIVYKLFKAVNPDVAFFGQKDYQQFLVIKKMCDDFSLPIKLVPCEIVREENGLAMSSRNIRLNEEEKSIAINIYKALNFIKDNYSSLSLAELKASASDFFSNNSLFNLEYLKICNSVSLDELTEKQDENVIALIACYVGKTRLIDNMILA